VGCVNPDGDGSEDGGCNLMASVFTLLGKRWTGMIMDALISSGPIRFSEIPRLVPGVSERMLSARLSELIEAGLVERQVLEGPPVGVQYQVTSKGDALRPALDELRRWAERCLEVESPQPDPT
jgi:DNA-binding HxlR family transcriptional regulator